MMPNKTSPVVFIVVTAQCVLALICVLAICLSLFYKTYSDPATLSALILLTGTLVGNLGSILGGPRMMMHIADTLAERMAAARAELPKVKTDEPPGEAIAVAPVPAAGQAHDQS